MNRFILIILILLSACQEKLIHDLPESEANKLIAKLSEAAIYSKKRQQADGLWLIEVKEEDVIRAIQLIEDTRIFKKPINDHYKSQLMSSSQEQKLIYERTLAQELEHTLESLVGVMEAHVYLNINNNKDIWKNLKTDQSNSSGAVLLIVGDQFTLNSQEVNEIVGGAAGINIQHINTVVNYPPLLDFSKLVVDTKTSPGELKQEEKQRYQQITSFFKSSNHIFGAGILIGLVSIGIILRVNSVLKIKKFRRDIAI